MDKQIKLVMSYVDGDGCTYSCDVDLPFMYESAEAALVDFEQAFLNAKDGRFNFVGHEFYVSSFREHNSSYVQLPNFYTLDEWFQAKYIN